MFDYKANADLIVPAAKRISNLLNAELLAPFKTEEPPQRHMVLAKRNGAFSVCPDEICLPVWVGENASGISAKPELQGAIHKMEGLDQISADHGCKPRVVVCQPIGRALEKLVRKERIRLFEQIVSARLRWTLHRPCCADHTGGTQDDGAQMPSVRFVSPESLCGHDNRSQNIGDSPPGLQKNPSANRDKVESRIDGSGLPGLPCPDITHLVLPF